MAFPLDRRAETDTTISFVQALTGSRRFKDLFSEGMCLVEEAAEYLDGTGRHEARGLSRQLNDSYSAESMRLTTRLMQIASWLLIRRAVTDGEMSPTQAKAERLKVRVSAQLMVSEPAVFAQLPAELQRLTRRSLRLQSRILHLDRMVNAADDHGDPTLARRGLEQQFERLRLVYGPAA